MRSNHHASPTIRLPLPWPIFALFVAAVAAVLVASSGCQTMGYHRANGTALGALTGTAVGAAVGDRAGGKALEGALIGGLTGAALGNQVGDSMDRTIAAQTARATQGLTTGDIIRLHQSGVSADIISRQIDVQGMQSMLTVDDVLALQRAGVDPAVIQVAQSRSASGGPQRLDRTDWSDLPGGPTIIAVDPGCPTRGYAFPPPVFYRPPVHHGVRLHWHW